MTQQVFTEGSFMVFLRHQTSKRLKLFAKLSDGMIQPIKQAIAQLPSPLQEVIQRDIQKHRSPRGLTTEGMQEMQALTTLGVPLIPKEEYPLPNTPMGYTTEDEPIEEELEGSLTMEELMQWVEKMPKAFENLAKRYTLTPNLLRDRIMKGEIPRAEAIPFLKASLVCKNWGASKKDAEEKVREYESQQN